MPQRETFGQRIRDLRTKKRISLRKFSEMLSISPTYLSKIERDEFNPPSEDKVRLMATLLEENPDELLGLAGRLSSDLSGIVQKNPKDMADFLRAANALPK